MQHALPWLLAFVAHPAMLGWLAAAAIPLVLHLWHRRRYRQTVWAAMEFLLAALQRHARRFRLEQILLLVVRTAVVALAVLALAEPFVERSSASASGGSGTHRILVVDGTLSMAYRPADKSRFDRAQELAVQLVEASSEGDAFTLMVLADPPRVVIGDPAAHGPAVLKEIEQLRLQHGKGDLAATLSQVEALLESAQRDHPRLVRHEVYFLTDLGRSTWLPPRGDAEAEALRDTGERLSRQARLVVVDVGRPDAENAAVTLLRCDPALAVAGQSVAFYAECRNFGRQERASQLVELVVDGQRWGDARVDLPPYGQATASWTVVFDAPGSHQVEVRLASDLLDLDNHQWYSVQVKNQLQVLCVNGRPASEPFEGATDFLVKALAPRGPTDPSSLVYAEVVPERPLAEFDLGAYDCVFLANLGRFLPGEADPLRRYLERGGGLVVFLGDQVEPESYNQVLAGDAPILPARLQAKIEEESMRSLDPLEFQHPILAAFRGRDRSGLFTAGVYGYFRLGIPEESTASVAMRLDNQDPLIVEHDVGRGKCILVATSADVSWTTMPMGASFLPLVHGLLRRAAAGRFEGRQRLAGEAIHSDVPPPGRVDSVVVQTPGGETLPAAMRRNEGGLAWSFSDTLESGIYEARLGESPEAAELFAVNPDTSESDLTTVTLDDLESELWPDTPLQLRSDASAPGEQPDSPLVARTPFHQWLLQAVLVLLVAETTLAWTFGRRAR